MRLLGKLITRAAEPTSAPLPGVIPPRRDVAGRDPLTLSAVYRAVDILTTAASQISIKVDRGGAPLADSDISSIIKAPSLSLTRADFIELWVSSLALTGNAYVRVHRYNGDPVELEILPPLEVRPARTERGRAIVYHHGARAYSRADILHTALLRRPGHLTGLGPIQAAYRELTGAADIRDYAARWLDNTGQPSGILSSDAALTANDVSILRNRWNGLDDQGERLTDYDNPSRIKVLGKGINYTPLFLKPEEAQWLEAQRFNTTMIARLFGIPAPLMLAALEGSSQTYSNVEQEWIAFTRFTLLKYLNKIAAALTELVPRGQTVRFNVDSLLRSDTKTRYEAHKLALDAGFLTIDEVRELENRPPLTVKDNTTNGTH